MILVVWSGYLAISDPLFRTMMKLSRQSDLLSHRYFGEISPERVFADAWAEMQQVIPFKVEIVADSVASRGTDAKTDWGLTLSFTTGDTRILAVTIHSPFHGILRRDDQIVSIGNLKSDIPMQLRKYLDENRGESVIVRFARDGITDSATVLLDPHVPRSDFVSAIIDNVAYFAVHRLDSQVRKIISDSLNSAEYNAATGIVIDLRDSEGESDAHIDKFTELFAEWKRELPLALLVNASTGRDAESFASLLLNKRDALIIGAPTRGLKTSAEDIQLWTGDKLHITSGSDVTVPDTSNALLNENAVLKSGRIVPHIRCAEPQISAPVLDLIHREYLLDFVAESPYDAMPTRDSEPELYERFMTFLTNKGYHYDPTGEALRELEAHLLSPDMRTNIDNMRRTQKQITPPRLDNYREEIIRHLLLTIQLIRVGGEPSAADRIRLDDYCLKTAVASLVRKKA